MMMQAVLSGGRSRREHRARRRRFIWREKIIKAVVFNQGNFAPPGNILVMCGGIFCSNNLFIYVWLCWAFGFCVEFSLVVVSGVYSPGRKLCAFDSAVASCCKARGL